jgi:hypothetical protein
MTSWYDLKKKYYPTVQRVVLEAIERREKAGSLVIRPRELAFDLSWPYNRAKCQLQHLRRQGYLVSGFGRYRLVPKGRDRLNWLRRNQPKKAGQR